MNRSNSASQTPLNKQEEQAESPMSVTNKQTEESQGISPEISAWLDKVVEGHKRMSTDEKYREEVENRMYNLGPRKSEEKVVCQEDDR